MVPASHSTLGMMLKTATKLRFFHENNAQTSHLNVEIERISLFLCTFVRKFCNVILTFPILNRIMGKSNIQ